MKCIAPKIIDIKCDKYKLLLKKHYPIENYWNGKQIEVGCGKCYYCKKRYATIWAKRCQLETIAQNEIGNKNNWFLTLTFENEPIKNQTLKKYLYQEATKFIQNLRYKNRYWKNKKRHYRKIKYVWVSEFGSANGRTHLHMLLWNLPIKDLETWKMSQTNNLMYISQNLMEIWKHGIISIQELTKENAAYLYKYEAKNYLQKCQSGGIGLTFFYTHLDDMLNEKQYQNRYFLKKYRQLLGDKEYYKWMIYELEQAKKYKKELNKKEKIQQILKLRDKLSSINSKMLKARDFHNNPQ